MKKTILSVVLIFLISSCATTVKFPVSSVTPAAEITAKIKKDKNKNFVILITTNYLASIERLSPPKHTYVVWMVTNDNVIKNIGQLKTKNAKEGSLNAVSSFEPAEIFLTAEDEGDVSNPQGIEISRVKVKK